MRTIYKNIVLAALAFSALACTKEDDFASSYLSDPNAVRITAQVGTNDVTGGFTRSNPLGTAEEQAKFNSGDAIAVAADGQDAVTYTFNGTAWTPASGKYLKWESNSMDFSAWYPVKEDTDAKNFEPSYSYYREPTLEELIANDYMTFTESKSKGADNSVSIEMTRQMVRIVIDEIIYNSQYTVADNEVTEIRISAGNSCYRQGVWEGSLCRAKMYKHSDGSWYAVLPPTAEKMDDAEFLNITVNGVTSMSVKGIPATEAGKSYKFSLTLGKDVASVGNVTVEDWNSGVIEGGVAKEMNCYLPKGSDFNSAIKSFLDKQENEGINAIKFIADPDWEPAAGDPQIASSGAYMIKNESTLEIRATAGAFVFHEDCSGMFMELQINVTSIVFNDCINTSNVINMQGMFKYSKGLVSLDLGSFNTSNVDNMYGMFNNCRGLKSITKMSNLSTIKVKDMSYMFNQCNVLQELDVSSFNTTSTIDMRSMFSYCTKLETINFGKNFDTGNVTDMAYMFQCCYIIKELDLTSFSFGSIIDVDNILQYTGRDYGTSAKPIPIKVTLDGYRFLYDRARIGEYAKYVKQDGVTPWTEADLQASGN